MDFTQLTTPEVKRIYHFPNDQTISIENVNAVCVRSSGTHRLETNDGHKWIIPTGWLAIELVVDNWTF